LPVEPGLALEARPVDELGLALEGRLTERGIAPEAHLAKLGLALEGRSIEPGGRESGVTLYLRSRQDALQQIGADDHPARINRALFADASEFSVEDVGGLLGSMGETPGRGGESDADATILVASCPFGTFRVGRKESSHSATPDD